MSVRILKHCLFAYLFVHLELVLDFRLCRDVLVTFLGNHISYDSFSSEIRDICKFDDHQPFTVKWVDEEGGYFQVLGDLV